MTYKNWTGILVTLASALAPAAAYASEGHGTEFSLIWAVPFAGILLSIAIFPLLLPNFWHHHYGKVSLAWAALAMVPLAAVFGVHESAVLLNEAIVGDFIPFILFVGVLFVVAGGIHIKGSFSGRPVGNLAFFIVGAALANNAPDPSASQGDRAPEVPRAYVCVLHLYRREYRRFPHAARRPAALHGIPEGR